MNKGLLISMILFVLLCALLLTDALFVNASINKMEETLSHLTETLPQEKQAELLSSLDGQWQKSRFLFSISLPRPLLYDTEEALAALRSAEKPAKKEREALALCLTRLKRGVLPDTAEIF